MPTSQPMATLLKQLTPVLKRHRFQREPNIAGIEIFSRTLDGYVERIGILSTTGEISRGDFAFSVAMGIEFTDLELERAWIGLPRTHGALELRLLNKAAQKEYICSADTDLKELAAQLVDLIVAASEELQRRSEKLRKAYLSLVEARGANARKRLAIFANRKALDLKQKSRKTKGAAAPAITSINVFEVAATLLRTKKDQRQELEIHEFDEADAHDQRLTQRIQQQLIDSAKAIEAELDNILGAPHETGTVEHRKLPINGVCYFAYWNVGWRLLYVAVSHEDVGLPCCLLMGAESRR